MLQEPLPLLPQGSHLQVPQLEKLILVHPLLAPMKLLIPHQQPVQYLLLQHLKFRGVLM